MDERQCDRLGAAVNGLFRRVRNKNKSFTQIRFSLMNIVDKIGRILADKALVHERVSEQEKQRRLSICESCARFDANARRCKVCKCYVDAKASAKTNKNPLRGRNEITHCPMGFWGDVDVANVYREIDGLAPIQ